MALTKVKNSNLHDADLVALAGNDGSALTGVLKTGDIGSTVQGYDANIATTSDITTAVSGLTSDIATAVSGLVDSAPGTLNTLNELAAALGDDENHATAMTTLINAKLSPDGDGSQLINLPASGGVIEAVASGALANGDKVILKTDGTVEIAGLSTIAQSIPAGSKAVFNSGSASNTNGISVAFDPNNAGKFVIAYQDIGNSDKGTAIVGTVSGTSITFGAEYVFESLGIYDCDIAFDPNNSGKFVIAYAGASGSILNNGLTVVGTVSGTSITFGSSATFKTADNTYYINIAFDPNTAGKFVIAWRFYTPSTYYYGMMVAGFVSGTSFIFGGDLKFQMNLVSYITLAFDPNNADQFVIAYKDHNNNYGTAIVGTLTGSNGLTCTHGSYYYFYTQNIATIDSVAFDPFAASANSTGKFVIAFTYSSGYGRAMAGTKSGTTLSFGSEYVYNTGDTQRGSIAFDPNISGKFAISYKDGSNSGQGSVIVGTLSGTTIAYGSEYVINSGSDTTMFVGSLSFDPNTSGKFVVAYADGGNNYYGTARTGQLLTSVTNLTADNYIGISDSAYADTATATIQVVGATDDAQSGLTTGSKHYVQTDGTLSTTPDSPSVYAGVALSATKLLIKG
jgi:hypothetical protein